MSEFPRHTYSANKVANALGVNANTVRDWARAQKVPSVKVGARYRFNLDEVRQAISNDKSLTAHVLDEV